MHRSLLFTLILVWIGSLSLADAFAPSRLALIGTQARQSSPLWMTSSSTEDEDDNEIVARRIIVTGDVQGGYYRTCVLNEAGKFRRLLGTMTPPDDSDTAEIYVEGKRKMVDGFVRWCKRGKVGLNQITTVKEVIEESPTGLYDGFYAKTH